MSLPKEPRQKMINMMYLVLTALLALNVSVEVLNAFKTVNHSIERSNQVVDQKNNITYTAFDHEQNDPQTKALASVWAPPALQVKKLSTELCVMLDSLKEKLILGSNPQMKDGKREFTDGNLDAATRVFDREGQGKVLYEALKKYRLDLLKVVDPANFPDQSEAIKKDLAATQAEFAKRLPIDTRIPESESGTASTGDSAKDWTVRYFHMTPTIAALTILSKFQSDVKNSESQVIDYLHKQIGEVKIKFDKVGALVNSNATYFMPGDNMEITAGVGAYSSTSKPDVSVNGQHVDLNADGQAVFDSKVTSSGEMNVKVQFTKPDGTVETQTKSIKYTVGQPSGASVFLEKMNVLYVKEENPIRISGGSVGREKVHVSFTNGEITHTEGDDWVAVPTTPGEGKIIVDADGKKTEFPMRVKFLPDPTGFVGAKKGGAISSAEFKAIGGLLAKLDNSEFQSSFKVVSYKLAALGGNVPQYMEAVNDGPKWSGSAANIVNKASPGTNIFFDDIRVVGKDGRTRTLPPMVFNLRQ